MKKIRINKNVLRFCVYSLVVSSLFLVSGFQYYSEHEISRLDDYNYYSESALRENLSDSQDKYVSLKTKLKDHVRELSVIIDSVNNLGLLSEQQVEQIEVVSADSSIGGLEYDITFNGSSDQKTLFDTKKELNDSDLLFLIQEYRKIIRGLPLAVPVENARTTSHYGYRRSPFSGKIKMHRGVDYASGYGKPVLAPANGKVKTVKYHYAYGRMIEIEHENNIITRYAHLAKTLVKKGEQVNIGQKIGTIGSSGKSTGPHLHYEIIVDKKQINPDKLIDLGKLIREIL